MFYPLKGYEGLYEIDRKGNIRTHNQYNAKRTAILKPATDGTGYFRVGLSKDCVLKTHKVHRLVALQFIPNEENKPQVNHIDGNKKNNSVENLEWCTISENIKHAYKNNLMTARRGELNGNSKLTLKDVEEIRAHAKNANKRYYGRKELAKKYNVSEAHIKDIVTKRRDIWK